MNRLRHFSFSALSSIVIAFCLMNYTAQAEDTQPHIPIGESLEGKTCYDCHIAGDKAASAGRVKYSIADAFETYQESPHGRLRAIGEQRAPMCEDCHGTREWSKILPQSHPESPIHPSNLSQTCAKCHGDGMLNTRVAEGSMHLSLTQRALSLGDPKGTRYGFLPGLTKQESSYFIGSIDVVAYVHAFFLFLTISVLSFMFLYVLLDFRRKLIERRTPSPTPVDSADDTKLRPRFNLFFRIQHICLFTAVILAILTGIPLKFPEAWLSQAFSNTLGAPEVRMSLHHISGIVMIVLGLFHVVYYVVFDWSIPFYKRPILPNFKDFSNFYQHMRYILGLRKDLPKMGRYTWYEKFDYVGVTWGITVMGITGLAMMYMDLTLEYIPLSWLQALWAAHSEEAMLATLFILIVHLYHVHFNPEKFPAALSWLHGKISKKEAKKYHPLELEDQIQEDDSTKESHDKD